MVSSYIKDGQNRRSNCGHSSAFIWRIPSRSWKQASCSRGRCSSRKSDDLLQKVERFLVQLPTGSIRARQFPITTMWPRHAMQIPTDPLGSDDPRPIPPLSQSRQGDMACQALYVRKHVQCASMGESEPAARGIEIHQVLATSIDHPVRTTRTTELVLFDALMKWAGTEAREVLEKFRDNHAFDPEKILATELHIALDENFIPIEHPSNYGQIS